MSREDSFFAAALKVKKRTHNLSRSDLFEIRDTAGVSIPGSVWTDCRVGRGVFDLAPLSGGSPLGSTQDSVTKLLGMTQDSESGTVTLAGGALMLVERGTNGKFRNPSPAHVQDVLTKFLHVRQAATAEDAAREEMTVEERFRDLEDLITLVGRGMGRALYVYGGAGIGKTHTVFDKLKALGLRRNVDYFVVKGTITTASLYQTLFMHRKNSLIVFDDCDSAWDSEDSANILKAALDSYETRTISWFSNRTINVSLWDEEKRAELEARIDDVLRGYVDDATTDDEEGEGDEASSEDAMDRHLAKLRKLRYPSEYKFESGVIFISNRGSTDVDEAVLSRCFKIDMTLRPQQVFDRIEMMIEHVGDQSLPKKKKLEILEALRNKQALGQLENANMRTFVAACNIVKSGVENWESLIRYA